MSCNAISASKSTSARESVKSFSIPAQRVSLQPALVQREAVHHERQVLLRLPLKCLKYTTSEER
jgi:hypothetical protein